MLSVGQNALSPNSLTTFGPNLDGKTFTGYAQPNSTINLTDGTQSGSTTADTSGAWSYTFTNAPVIDAIVVVTSLLSVGYRVTAPTLGPNTVNYTLGSLVAGQTLVTITGLYSDEFISTVSPNDGKLALSNNKKSLLIGLTDIVAGTVTYTLTTNINRTFTLSVVAKAVSVPVNTITTTADTTLAGTVVNDTTLVTITESGTTPVRPTLPSMDVTTNTDATTSTVLLTLP